MEDMEVRATVDAMVGGMYIWVVELVSGVHTNQ